MNNLLHESSVVSQLPLKNANSQSSSTNSVREGIETSRVLANGFMLFNPSYPSFVKDPSTVDHSTMVQYTNFKMKLHTHTTVSQIIKWNGPALEKYRLKRKTPIISNWKSNPEVIKTVKEAVMECVGEMGYSKEAFPIIYESLILLLDYRPSQ